MGFFLGGGDKLMLQKLLDLVPEDKKERSTHVLALADFLNLGTRSFQFTESQSKAE